MKIRSLGSLLVTGTLIVTPLWGGIFGEVLEFSSVWEKVAANSPSLRTKNLEIEAARSASDRAGLHWFPKLYTDVRTYQTDDPILNFTGKLGQRSATQSDFSTASNRSNLSNFLDSNNQLYQNLNPNSANIFAKDTLNRPGSNGYSRGTLGLEFPLYEGGSKEAFREIKEKELQAQIHESEYFNKTLYIQTAIAFRSSLIFSEGVKEREKILRQLSSFSSTYRLDSFSNPVGHSGSLALKSVQLRLISEIKEKDLYKKESLESIKIMSGGVLDNLQPSESSLAKFYDENLPLSVSASEVRTPVSKMLESYSGISKDKVSMENSKFLPKVGVYAEAYGYAGDRNFANSYNAGVYLQMNLLNPTDIGSKKEAEIQAKAAETKWKEARLKENSEFKILSEKERVLFQAGKDSEESYRIQYEQLILSQTLFKRGNIPATSLAESFSRTADALTRKEYIDLEYLRTRAQLTLYSGDNNASGN
ncbi:MULTISPECIES: TolC family protein [unclassified Leptospira]|uniref:TolC family protein n=1 Tax=unclassified Leptospira TaxID=2633828 RepID=UPI00056D86D2|nr:MULTISPECIES: TolC family protein [unclassified Leptospira]MCR1792180.1 TolC family protein [Leptospira sp. id769339]